MVIWGTTLFSPECKTPEEFFVAKPSAVIESWYGPGAMFAMEYCPSSPDCASWLADWSWRVSFTRAPATAVPFGSTIVPWMVPGSGGAGGWGGQGEIVTGVGWGVGSS